MGGQMFKFPVHIQHEDDGTIVVVDADNVELFHVCEKGHHTEEIVQAVIKAINE